MPISKIGLQIIMSDIKLFPISNNKVTELEGKSVTIEKTL